VDSSYEEDVGGSSPSSPQFRNYFARCFGVLQAHSVAVKPGYDLDIDILVSGLGADFWSYRTRQARSSWA
jgi:hypothetical protein